VGAEVETGWMGEDGQLDGSSSGLDFATWRPGVDIDDGDLWVGGLFLEWISER